MDIGRKLTVAKNVVTSKAGRQLLKGQKHSPTLLFGAGVIGVVATAVMASRATLQLEEVLETNEVEQKRAKLALAKNDKRYTNKEYTADMAKLKTRLIVDVSKLYAPAVIVGAVSIASLTGSHVILNRRYTGAVAAYAALDRGYAEYRQRVAELLGVDKERELNAGSTTREIAVDTENGVEIKTIQSSAGQSPYARLFSRETSTSWNKEGAYNLAFLSSVQRYSNDMLHAKGFVILNDVYDSLGMERTKAGCVTGWVKDNKNGGDNYIDFNIWDDKNMMAFHDFVTSEDGAIWLDFNVDGIVYDLI